MRVQQKIRGGSLRAVTISQSRAQSWVSIEISSQWTRLEQWNTWREAVEAAVTFVAGGLVTGRLPASVCVCVCGCVRHTHTHSCILVFVHLCDVFVCLFAAL